MVTDVGWTWLKANIPMRVPQQPSRLLPCRRECWRWVQVRSAIFGSTWDPEKSDRPHWSKPASSPAICPTSPLMASQVHCAGSPLHAFGNALPSAVTALNHHHHQPLPSLWQVQTPLWFLTTSYLRIWDGPFLSRPVDLYHCTLHSSTFSALYQFLHLSPSFNKVAENTKHVFCILDQLAPNSARHTEVLSKWL